MEKKIKKKKRKEKVTPFTLNKITFLYLYQHTHAVKNNEIFFQVLTIMERFFTCRSLNIYIFFQNCILLFHGIGLYLLGFVNILEQFNIVITDTVTVAREVTSLAIMTKGHLIYYRFVRYACLVQHFLILLLSYLLPRPDIISYLYSSPPFLLTCALSSLLRCLLRGSETVTEHLEHILLQLYACIEVLFITQCIFAAHHSSTFPGFVCSLCFII